LGERPRSPDGAAQCSPPKRSPPAGCRRNPPARGIKLPRQGKELVGPSPICGGANRLQGQHRHIHLRVLKSPAMGCNRPDHASRWCQFCRRHPNRWPASDAAAQAPRCRTAGGRSPPRDDALGKRRDRSPERGSDVFAQPNYQITGRAGYRSSSDLHAQGIESDHKSKR
jgi:hypothetical protein